jgi:hypothetical protein
MLAQIVGFGRRWLENAVVVATVNPSFALTVGSKKERAHGWKTAKCGYPAQEAIFI